MLVLFSISLSFFCLSFGYWVPITNTHREKKKKGRNCGEDNNFQSVKVFLSLAQKEKKIRKKIAGQIRFFLSVYPFESKDVGEIFFFLFESLLSKLKMFFSGDHQLSMEKLWWRFDTIHTQILYLKIQSQVLDGGTSSDDGKKGYKRKKLLKGEHWDRFCRRVLTTR